MICLNNKDADWIAAIAREELKHTEEVYQKSSIEIAELKKGADELHLRVKGEDKGYAQFCNKFDSITKSMEKDFTEHKQKWIRIIELMIGGSDER